MFPLVISFQVKTKTLQSFLLLHHLELSGGLSETEVIYLYVIYPQRCVFFTVNCLQLEKDLGEVGVVHKPVRLYDVSEMSRNIKESRSVGKATVV